MVYGRLNSIQLKLPTTHSKKTLTQAKCNFCHRALSTRSLIRNSYAENVEITPNDDNDSQDRCFSADLVCEYCSRSLSQQKARCFTCGLLINSEMRSAQIQTCGACLSNTPVQYRSICAFDYLFPFPEWLSQIKYQTQLHNIKALSALFSEYCLKAYKNDVLPECIVPVPLHPNREWVRGFNQTHLFSQLISHHLGIPYDCHIAKRINNTSPQMSLSIKERENNMKNAFKRSSRSPTSNNLKHIALFDDIMTTGSTLGALANAFTVNTQIISKGTVLSIQGVKRIDFWSLCRTPKPANE